MRHGTLLIFLPLLLIAAGRVDAADARYTVVDNGLASLSWNGLEFIGDPLYQGEFNLYGTTAAFRTAGGTIVDRSGPPATRTHAGDTVTFTYPWGRIVCTWTKPAAGRLAWRITVENSSPDTLTRAGGTQFVLDFPGTPPVQDSNGDGSIMDYPRVLDPLRGPPLAVLGLGSSGAMTLCIDGDPRRPWRLGNFLQFNSNDRWSARWDCDEEIPPGQARSMDFSLRFTTGPVAFAAAAPDVLMRYAGALPPLGERLDRRPIARDFLCNPPPHPGGNPRGYFQNSTAFDVRTVAGREELRRQMLARADRTILNLQAVDAQGVIVWDIEGQQEPHPTSYVGSPDRIYEIAPEMAHVGSDGLTTAQAYFKRFTDAGFKVGVCIRPQRYTDTAGSATGPHEQVEENERPWDVVKAKIDFAVTRFGCSLIYVDSNASNTLGAPMPDRALLAPALASHPGIRIMGEWQDAGSYGTGAPYDATIYDEVVETSDRLRQVWPDANGSICLVDASPYDALNPRYAAAMKRGDVLLFDAWYASTSLAAVKTIRTLAGQRPACSLTAPAANAMLIAGSPVQLRAGPAPGDGSITQVVFRSGGVEIGQATTSPWQMEWTPTLPGAHILTATACDDRGSIGVSSHRLVHVVDPTAPDSDIDGDGICLLLESALGSDPLVPNPAPPANVGIDSTFLTLTYSRSKSASAITLVAEVCSSPAGGWTSAPASIDQRWRITDAGPLEIVTARDRSAVTESGTRFIRLKVTGP